MLGIWQAKFIEQYLRSRPHAEAEDVMKALGTAEPLAAYVDPVQKQANDLRQEVARLTGELERARGKDV